MRQMNGGVVTEMSGQTRAVLTAGIPHLVLELYHTRNVVKSAPLKCQTILVTYESCVDPVC
jgi:hypothetical protein